MTPVGFLKTVWTRSGLLRCGLFLLLGLAAAPAWAQPANDNFASAIAITGAQGSQTGNNRGASKEVGEPDHAGNHGGASVWYTWVAPFSGLMQFNTEGSGFDTVLAAYIIQGSETNIANLVSSGFNDDVNFPADLTSQMTFTVTEGTQYFIAVDGYGGATGPLTLGWHPVGALSAGKFSFASPIASPGDGIPLYVFSDRESAVSAHPDMPRNNRPLITISRSGGSSGRVRVNFTVTNGYWGDLWSTNLFGTNYFSTNVTDNTYSNVLVTNIMPVNFPQVFQVPWGFWNPCSITNDFVTNQIITVQGSGATLTSSNYNEIIYPATNAVFPTLPLAPPNTTSNNGVVLKTVPFTNSIPATNIVATANPSSGTNVPVDYEAYSDHIDFNDYQMSATLTITNYQNFLPWRFVRGRDPLVLVTIDSVELYPGEGFGDPAETTNIAPPTIDMAKGMARVSFQNQQSVLATSTPDGDGICFTTNSVINFERSHFRVPESQGVAHIGLIRSGFDPAASVTINYRVASVTPYDFHWNQNDFFNNEPGSDYATPDTTTSIPNPPAPASTEPPDFTPVTGTISWGSYDNQVKFIDIPISPDNLVEFNEDFMVTIWVPAGSAPNIGQTSTAIVTINSPDEPAGAADVTHNPSGSANTDPPFNEHPGASGSAVYALAVQPDGKTVFGGDFQAFNGKPQYFNLGRMNANGSADLGFMGNFNQGPNGVVTCLALSPDSNIYIGGGFTSYNATNRFGVARLKADSSLDLTFNPGVGANDTVWSMALQPDGKLLVAGGFTFFNATNRSHIVRLNVDGTVDPTFNPGLGPDGTVNTIALQQDGRILIGGEFTLVSNTNRPHIARLNADGSLDASFDPAVGADGPIYAIAIQGDGRILIGGAFSMFNLGNHNHLTRLNADGSLDVTFDPGSGPDDTVYSILMQPDGNILIGGMFASVNSTRRIAIARLLPNGWVDTTFMDTAHNQFAGLINRYADRDVDPKNFLFTMALQDDGNIMIGGSFQRVGGGGSRDSIQQRQNVARLIGGSTPGPGNIGLVDSSYTVGENDGNRFITLTRENGSLGPASVSFGTVATGSGPGAAVQGKDYNPPSNPNPTWPNSAWGNNATWMYYVGTTGVNTGNGDNDNESIRILDNGSLEGDRTLGMQVFQPSSEDIFFLGGNGNYHPDYGSLNPGYGMNIPLGLALGLTHAPLTIVDNESDHGTFGFSSPTYQVSENGGTATINVVRTGGTAGRVTVQYTTANGTAVAGSTNDYTAASGQLVFGDRDTVKPFTVTINNNSAVQPDRTVNLRLFNVTGGGNAGLTNATLTIVDDDFLPGRLSFSTTNFTAHESDGNALVTVTRTGGNATALTVSYATSDGTAINGTHYTGKTNLLSWSDGDTAAKTFTVPLFHDGLVTSNLTVNLRLFNPIINGTNNNTALGSLTNSTLTIINDDFYGSPAFSTATYTVNENSGIAHITVVREGGSAQTIAVPYSTVDGTAQDGVDYLGASGTLTFGPGEFSKGFDITILNDAEPNGNRFLNLQLGAPSPAGVTNNAPSSALLTIVDDESFNEPPGGLDLTYNPNAFFNGNVYALALQPQDAKLIVGGDFTLANSFVRNRIARMNPDGSLDVKFSSPLDGANNSVRSLAVQSDGRILAGGLFTSFNNVGKKYFTRLNPDGSLDSAFNTGAGPDNPVYSIAETFLVSGTNATRKIILGGSFVSFNGKPRSGIARLNDDGTLDTAFDPGLGANGTVYAVAIYPANDVNSGKILIAGDFTKIGNLVRNHVARLNADGSVDPTFDPVDGPNDSVRSLAIQVDGNVLIGGMFTSVNGTPINRIARLLSGGGLDTSFNPGLGADDIVSAIVLQEDQKVLLGGSFSHVNGVTRNRVTRLNSDGSVDPAINFGLGANDFIAALAVQSDSKILVGGGFTTYDGLTRQHLARIFGRTMIGQGEFEFTSANYQVNENGTNVVISVRRTGGTGDTNTGDVYITVQTSDDSALAGVDYQSVSTQLDFPVGETFATVTIPVIDNLLVESNKSFNLSLVNPIGGELGGQTVATVTIINDDSTVSFEQADYRVARNVGNGAALITIVRSNSTVGTSLVNFMTTSSGTAVPGVDYQPVITTVQFDDGESLKTVAVPVIDNGMPGGLTVGLELSNPQNTVLLAPTEATMTILDNSLAAGNVAFASATGYTVNENGVNAVITLVRTNGSIGQISVAFSASGGTAVPGVDYAMTNGTVAFADGELTKQILIPVYPNAQVTGSRTVNLTLSNPTGGAGLIGPTTVPLTILDVNVGVSFSAPAYFVNETAGAITITVQRVGGTNTPFTVQYSTAPGTALVGSNYVTASGMLNFTSNELFKTFDVPILYNPSVQGDLILFVNLSNPSGGVQLADPSAATITVVDTDSGFSFGSATNVVSETDTNAVITVVRSGSLIGTRTVSVLTTDDGTAASGQRYVATNGVLTFLDGQAVNYFILPIINNTVVDGDQTVDLVLSGASGSSQLLDPTNTVLTIVDDDAGLSFSSDRYTVNEGGGHATITVLRTGVLTNTVSVTYNVPSGPPNKYVPTSGTLVFTNGETSKTFDVTIIDNTTIEGDLSIPITLGVPPAPGVLQNPSAATLTIVDNDGSLIVPAGSALVTESGPVNNVIDPNETVSVLFAFRNSAGENSPNVTATLLATNGVTPTGTTSQSYGPMAVGGPSVSRLFSFIASGTNGGRIRPTFRLQDGVSTTTNSFSFTLGTSQTGFTNSNLIAINDQTSATPYPSTNIVSGLDGVISKVTVTLSDFSHRSLSDVQMLLVSPSGQKELLMVGAGTHLPVSHVTLTFDDAATNSLSTDSAPTTGTYKPGVLTGITTFPVPAPVAPYGTNLSAFNGSNPNGIWSLYVLDRSALDDGGITNGWRLNITTTALIQPASDLAAGLSAAPNPVVVNSNLIYTIGLTNYGPAAASGAKVTDTLPPGLTFVSASAPAGATFSAGVVTFNFGTLATNASATATLTVTPTVIGLLTNTVAASSSQTDGYPDNNTASAVAVVSPASADLGIGVIGTPDPVALGGNVTYAISVTNLGPATATGVTVTNFLPAGVSIVSAPNGQTGVPGLVTWSVGTLGSGGHSNLTLVLKLLNGGTYTNSVSVGSAVTDPFKSNNSASTKTVVEAIQLGGSRVGNNLILTWPQGFVLESTANLALPGSWTTVTSPTPQLVNGQWTVTIPLPTSGSQFFRLRASP